MSVYAQLEEIHRRPAPFECYTAPDLWTDEHTSSKMLEYHLDPAGDLSSRNAAFIERSAEWIVRRFGLAEGRRVADFGCGPGLYTTRLARAGANVTGIDFSERSLRHARERARNEGLSVDYVCANYLEFASEGSFDLITQIMCDFCALSPAQRKALLGVFLSHLEPGGAVLLDVYSLAAFEAREEQAIYAPNLLDGFWSPDPYFGFLNTFKYEAEKVILDKYTLIEESRVRTVYNWLQYFSEESLTSEIEGCGLVIDEVLGDVAGSPMSATAPEFAVVARRPVAS